MSLCRRSARLDLRHRQGLGDDLAQQVEFHQQTQPTRGLFAEQDLIHLLGHALAADVGQLGALSAHHIARRPFDGEGERGSEAHRAQQTQRVLGEALSRVAHGAHQPVGEIILAAEGIDQFAAGDILGHGVDGEVTARQILPQRDAEGDLGLA